MVQRKYMYWLKCNVCSWRLLDSFWLVQLKFCSQFSLGFIDYFVESQGTGDISMECPSPIFKNRGILQNLSNTVELK
jgi:hypothetical protein